MPGRDEETEARDEREKGALDYPSPRAIAERVRAAAAALPREAPPAGCDSPPPSPRWR